MTIDRNLLLRAAEALEREARCVDVALQAMKQGGELQRKQRDEMFALAAALSAPTPEPSEVTQEQVEEWIRIGYDEARARASERHIEKDEFERIGDMRSHSLAYAAGRAAAGKDAERYTWLRDASLENGRIPNVTWWGKELGDALGKEFDAAIDRAIEKEPAK